MYTTPTITTLSIIPVIVTFSCFLLRHLFHLPVHSLCVMWTGGCEGATLHMTAQTFQSLSDLNSWSLTMCVPSSWVPFSMSLLREVAQFQIFSVLLNGKLDTDCRWAVECGTGNNT